MKHYIREAFLKEAVAIVRAYRLARKNGLKTRDAEAQVAQEFGCSKSKVTAIVYNKANYSYSQEALDIVNKEEEEAARLALESEVA